MARVLVVEDSPELAGLIAAAASSRGHSIRTVGTAAAALAVLASERFDAAVVDLQLPDMKGTQVLSQLRQRNIPALAMSGHFKGEDVALEATRVYGAREF